MESPFESQQLFPSKSCTKCGKVKPFAEFPSRTYKGRPKRYLQPYCRECDAAMHRKSWRKKASDPLFQAKRIEKQRWAYRVGRKHHKCNDCGATVDDGKVHCPPCREKRRIKEMERRAQDRKFKLCPSCGEPNTQAGRKLCVECSTSIERKYARQYRYEWSLRLRAFDAYGGPSCACCGETEPKFLTIDHIDGNGNEHRRSISHNGEAGAVKMYRWLAKNKYPEGMFQVLCFNCNCGKYRNRGTCPHKTKENP